MPRYMVRNTHYKAARFHEERGHDSAGVSKRMVNRNIRRAARRALRSFMEEC